jgi:dolichol-phosphate mannosyltransferase
MKTPTAPRLTVVTPLANEEATVREFVARVVAQLRPDDRLVCVLDRASRDRTRALVEEMAGTEPRVSALWCPDNRCVVDAYFAGYRAALAAGSRWVLEMDGGLSHAPEAIPRFVAAMEGGAEFAAGTRFANGGSYHGPALRYVLSRGGTVLANLLLGTRMSDMTSGFQCFSRPALSRVLRQGVRSRAHFFQTEIRFLLHDLRWIEVPIDYRNPSKGVGWASVAESFRNLWWLARHGRAMREASRS